jgi:hypothetical protein
MDVMGEKPAHQGTSGTEHPASKRKVGAPVRVTIDAMVNQVPILRRSRKAAQELVACAMLLCAAGAAPGQGTLTIPEMGPYIKPEPKVFEKYPEKPSLTPAFTMPVGPLGFSAPSDFYLFRGRGLVSLDFLDENRLLFTFRKPGLGMRGAESGEDEEKLRAVVIALADGRIDPQADWVVPDGGRYLWMLKDGHYLLRSEGGLLQGDATLTTRPYLDFPGRLLWVDLDPDQRTMVTNSLESSLPSQPSDQAHDPPRGPSATTTDAQKPSADQTLVVRTLNRETGQLIKMIRLPWDAQNKDWPVNADGYVVSSHDKDTQWTLHMDSFSGAMKVLGHMDSTCMPDGAFATEAELLVKTCAESGGGKLTAMSAVDGKFTWQATTATNAARPLLVASPDGSRVALEAVVLRHAASHYRHMKQVDPDELEGQMVRVLDTADGTLKLEAPLSPMLDGGGNVAISPTGRRVAILNDGAIEVFDLPAARLP